MPKDVGFQGSEMMCSPIASGQRLQKKPWKITSFNGKTHYTWAIFNSKLLNYQRDNFQHVQLFEVFLSVAAHDF